MKQIEHYTITYGATLYELEKCVQELVAEGYRPVGGPFESTVPENPEVDGKLERGQRFLGQALVFYMRK